MVFMSSKKVKNLCMIGILVTGLLAGGLIYQSLLSPQSVEAQKTAIDTNATEDSVVTLTEAINNFSLELYTRLCTGNYDNVFFSPYSIFVALAMTYEGANGTTAQEMRDVLKFQQNNDTIQCSFGKIYNLLNINAEYILKTANALWTQDNYPFLLDYLHFIENYYMGKATGVDFNDADQTAQLISQWVEENTGGKIKDLIKSDDIHPLTRLILTNAIYFEGSWKYQFPLAETTYKVFEISENASVEVPMMSISDAEVNLLYTETENLQILELPYESLLSTLTIMLSVDEEIYIISWGDFIYGVCFPHLDGLRLMVTEIYFEPNVPRYPYYEFNQSMMDEFEESGIIMREKCQTSLIIPNQTAPHTSTPWEIISNDEIRQSREGHIVYSSVVPSSGSGTLEWGQKESQELQYVFISSDGLSSFMHPTGEKVSIGDMASHIDLVRYRPSKGRFLARRMGRTKKNLARDEGVKNLDDLSIGIFLT